MSEQEHDQATQTQDAALDEEFWLEVDQDARRYDAEEAADIRYFAEDEP